MKDLLKVLGTVAAGVGTVLVFIHAVPVRVDLGFIGAGATAIGIGVIP